MERQILLRGPLVLAVCLILVSVGCSTSRTSTRTRWSHTICQGDLDECRELKLSYDVIRDREGMGPAREYEELTLEVSPREHLRFRRALKTIELKFGVARGQLRFRGVEVRTDKTRAKVWFVEGDTRRIIATLDRVTGETTGPDDEAPAWARPDAGVLLESSAE